VEDAGIIIKKWNFEKKIGLIVPCLLLLFAWPIQFIYPKIFRDPLMDQQMDNVSFCLDNLSRNEKVFCFSQNQIYFDPVIKEGESIYKCTAKKFKNAMIADQCKVIINDYRTLLLNDDIKKMIKNNYIFTKIGNILIPGFEILPKRSIEKMVWIEGYYYCPTNFLEINGRPIEGNLTYLKQKRYIFKNLSDRKLCLIFVFEPENILNKIRSSNKSQ
jgi:hypothetical protein